MATVEKAIQFIRSHGHFAAETADGLLAISGVCMFSARLERYEYSHDNGETIWSEHCDNYAETMDVLPIDNGNVSTRAVRDWLGY